MKRQARFIIPPTAAGVTLLDFLARRFTYHPRETWDQIVTRGDVQVNGSPAAAAVPLNAGDVIEYLVPDLPEPPVSREVGVLFEDADLLIVNKPAHLPCHPGGAFFNHTLWALLKQDFGIASPAFVNRLDRETSGIVLVAKTTAAAGHCRAQFASRRVRKRYLAIVEGHLPLELHACGVLVSDAACAVRKKRQFVARPAVPHAVPDAPRPDEETAETSFRAISYHQDMTLVEAAPVTGRLHQIRATLCSLGFPVVGDKIYGPDPNLFIRFCAGTLTEEDRCRLRLDRQALHAAELEFRHPRTGQPVTFLAPLPDDMRQLLT